jgi:hypothetical protein
MNRREGEETERKERKKKEEQRERNTENQTVLETENSNSSFSSHKMSRSNNLDRSNPLYSLFVFLSLPVREFLHFVPSSLLFTILSQLSFLDNFERLIPLVPAFVTGWLYLKMRSSKHTQGSTLSSYNKQPDVVLMVCSLRIVDQAPLVLTVLSL